MKKLFLLFFLTVPLLTIADDSGECGYNLSYTYTETHHTLTINGSGTMMSFGEYSRQSPWYAYRTEITTIVINNGPRAIGEYAFNGCCNATSINIPNGVTMIYKGAFKGCSSLATITIPEGVHSIGESAFDGCSTLKSISLPNSTSSIGNCAFSGCDNLKKVTCAKVTPPLAVNNDAFKNTPVQKAVLYVPSGSIDTYSQKTPWSNFKHIVAIGSEPPVDKYNLIYKIDGSVYKSYELEVGAVITAEETPVKEEYTFSGWSEIPSTMPDDDVIITGSFIANKYKITYMVDDEVYKVVEYGYETEVKPLGRPSGNYDTFEWENLPSTMPAHDVVVNAKYTMKEPEPEPMGHKMILSFKNGDIVSFVLKDKPEISFSGGLFVIDSKTGAIEYQRSDIEDFHFEEIETSVESIEYSGNSSVTIYDMNGHLIANLRNESLNSAKMYLNTFKPGMYIIKIGNQTIKYLKK